MSSFFFLQPINISPYLWATALLLLSLSFSNILKKSKCVCVEVVLSLLPAAVACSSQSFVPCLLHPELSSRLNCSPLILFRCLGTGAVSNTSLPCAVVQCNVDMLNKSHKHFRKQSLFYVFYLCHTYGCPMQSGSVGEPLCYKGRRGGCDNRGLAKAT